MLVFQLKNIDVPFAQRLMGKRKNLVVAGILLIGFIAGYFLFANQPKEMRVFAEGIPVKEVTYRYKDNTENKFSMVRSGQSIHWEAYYSHGPQVITITLQDGRKLVLELYGADTGNTRYRDIVIERSAAENSYKVFDYVETKSPNERSLYFSGEVTSVRPGKGDIAPYTIGWL